MKFTATLLSVAVAASAFTGVSAGTKTQKDSNAQRLARGLPPLKPRSLFDDKRHRALAPRASIVPGDSVDLTDPIQTPGGTCGCTYVLYSADTNDGEYYPYVGNPTPIQTETDTNVASCEILCDSNPNCNSGLFQDGTCNLYDVFGGSDSAAAPAGLYYFEYNEGQGACTGTC